eukprot:8394371-Pyramimonas_sp.AAC.2
MACFLKQNGPGPPRARRPCPSPMPCFPMQSGPGPPRTRRPGPSPTPCFPMQSGPALAHSATACFPCRMALRAAALPLAHGVFSHAKWPRGGPAPHPWLVLPRRVAAALAAAQPLAHSMFSNAKWPGAAARAAAAARPCPSPMASFPTQSGHAFRP